jgi:hypothetical protein
VNDRPRARVDVELPAPGSTRGKVVGLIKGWIFMPSLLYEDPFQWEKISPGGGMIEQMNTYMHLSCQKHRESTVRDYTLDRRGEKAL